MRMRVTLTPVEHAFWLARFVLCFLSGLLVLSFCVLYHSVQCICVCTCTCRLCVAVIALYVNWLAVYTTVYNVYVCVHVFVGYVLLYMTFLCGTSFQKW